MERRLRALERLARGEAGGGPGLDGLLDLLLGLHHELSSAPLRRERNVAQFLSWGEWPGRDRGGRGWVGGAQRDTPKGASASVLPARRPSCKEPHSLRRPHPILDDLRWP